MTTDDSADFGEPSALYRKLYGAPGQPAQYGDLLKPDEIALLTGRSEQTVLRWLGEGKLAGFRPGGQWIIERDAFYQFMIGQANTPQPPPPPPDIPPPAAGDNPHTDSPGGHGHLLG